jgi:hypothetical protein
VSDETQQTNTNTQTTDNTTQTTPWHGADQAEYVTTKGWKSGADAVTSYRNLETIWGADKAGRAVMLPKDDKDVEGLKAFREKLGVPADVKGYAVPEALRESLKDDPLVPVFAQAALEENIPAKAFGNLLSKVLAAAQKRDEDAAAADKVANEKTIGELKAKHGDKYDANLEMGERALAKLGVKEDAMAALRQALGKAGVVELFMAIGQGMGEAAGAGGEKGGGGTSREEAQSKIDDARQKRIANQMTEADYLKVVEKYGPIANPGERAA